MGRREWAHEVNVDVGKFLRGDRNVLWDSMSMAVNFVQLTGGTLASPVGNLGGHTTPKEAGGNKPFGGTDTRVGEVVKMFKDGFLKGKWD
jgi:hypothetical protein